MGASPSKDEHGRMLKDTEAAASRRSNIAKELLATETTYVDSLATVQEVFLVPLADESKAPIPQGTVRAIFSIWENIAGFHKVFMPMIKQRVDEWSPASRIGDVFLQNSDFMRMYAQYANGYTGALEALTNAKKSNSKFASFLETTYQNPRLRGLELGSYLIMPIQRIPRYVMLLQDLVKHTPIGHQDYESLVAALSKVQEIAVSINEKKRDAENQAKILEIDQIVGGKPESLVKPYRYYIFEGPLNEVAADKTTKPSYVYLFSDVLLIARINSTAVSMLGGTKYTLKLAFPLDRLVVGPGAHFTLIDFKSPALKTHKDKGDDADANPISPNVSPAPAHSPAPASSPAPAASPSKDLEKEKREKEEKEKKEKEEKEKKAKKDKKSKDKQKDKAAKEKKEEEKEKEKKEKEKKEREEKEKKEKERKDAEEKKQKEAAAAASEKGKSSRANRKSVLLPEVFVTLQAETKEIAFEWIQKIQEAQVAIRIKNNAWEKAIETKGGAQVNNACCIIS